MTPAELVALLPGKTSRTSSGWEATCPNHMDENPSLSIGQGDDGRVLIHCHAGCTVEEVVGSMALTMADLFVDEPSTHVARPAGCNLAALATATGHDEAWLADVAKMCSAEYNGRPAVAVPYCDERGRVLRTKYRLRVGDGPGPKYRWGDGDEQYPWGLWRLPAARDAGKGLVLTEGETDAMAVWAAGGHALCIPGATAVSVLRPEHVDAFRGRLWVTRDNDDGAGLDFVKRVAAVLADWGHPEPPRVIQPPPAYKDVADWRLGVGATAWPEVLRDAARVARPWEERSPVVWASELEPRPLDFICYPYFPRGYVTMVAGKPGMGKTLLGCSLVAAVSTNGRFGTCQLAMGAPTRSLLISAEDDPRQVLRGRLEGLGARMDRVAVYDFEAADEELMLDADGVRRLERMVEQYGPGVVVLDPLVTFVDASVDIYRANEVRAVLRPLVAMARRCDIAVVVVAHVKKGAVSEAIDGIGGSVDFAAAVRSALATYRDPEAGRQEQGYVLAHIKHNLTQPGPPQRYRIEPSEADPLVPDLVWLGQSMYAPHELAREQAHAEDLEEASAFLEAELAGGHELPVPVLRKEARKLGLSEGTLRTARRKLGIEQYRRIDGMWFYRWVPQPGDDAGGGEMPL